MREILTAGRYFRKKFGCNVYKVPVSIFGFTCPNIDGSVAKGGCVFCENESFSPNLTGKGSKKIFLNPNSKENPLIDSQLLELEKQYKKTKKILSKKFSAEKFIIYFQSFTNTYAPLETLKKLYEKALSCDEVVGLSIGTRTDAITEEILEYLSDLQKDKEIWIEYGIQSIYDETLQKINRGHDAKNIYKWVKKTKEYGLKVCGHLIFGLPGEDENMMLNSVQASVDMGIECLKIHPCYIVKNTALANRYKKGDFTPISEEKYIDILIKSIKMTRSDMLFQRVTAGVSSDTLLAPMWCGNKHEQMRKIKNAFLQEGLVY